MPVLTENKKAYFNYEILESFEAGIELKGFEVKAVKSGLASLTGAFATIHDSQIFLTNFQIQPYQPKNTPADYNPTRSRRLLLNKKEITYLASKMPAERLTLVPLKLYTKGNLVKVELGLARGKRKYEKREAIKKRDVKKEIGRTLKSGR